MNLAYGHNTDLTFGIWKTFFSLPFAFKFTVKNFETVYILANINLTYGLDIGY